MQVLLMTSTRSRQQRDAHGGGAGVTDSSGRCPGSRQPHRPPAPLSASAGGLVRSQGGYGILARICSRARSATRRRDVRVEVKDVALT